MPKHRNRNSGLLWAGIWVGNWFLCEQVFEYCFSHIWAIFQISKVQNVNNAYVEFCNYLDSLNLDQINETFTVNSCWFLTDEVFWIFFWSFANPIQLRLLYTFHKKRWKESVWFVKNHLKEYCYIFNLITKKYLIKSTLKLWSN